MVLQQVPNKGRTSVLVIQNLNVRKRQPFTRIVYGCLMVAAGLIMVVIDPVQIFTNWKFEIKEGSSLFKMWETPTYQLFAEVWVYNYTNVPEYLDGQDKVLKLQEIGPFLYQEFRTNQNLTIDRERGVMSMIPNTKLQFLRNQSVADTNDVQIYVPNVALLAISTIFADKLGYLGNVGAYYSINALGSKLFRNLTVEELLWGYEDPTVTIANNLLPGWIDFDKIGILDRFYAQKDETAEVEISDPKTRFSIVNWNDSPGIVEQQFTDLNTSIPCNRARGTYEGLMIAPNIPKNTVIPIFRRQACRIYPFIFQAEMEDKYDFNYYRFMMATTAFNTSSPYACTCKSNCLPDGFVDVSNCYYGFPIALSKPHFLDADPEQMSYYEGLKPDRKKHVSALDIEPILGVPLGISSKIQVNVAVRMSSGNPITKPFENKVVPLLWISLHCKEPPTSVLNILWIRLILAPPLIMTIEAFLIIVGFIIGVHGCYRCLRPKYIIIGNSEDKKMCNNGNIDILENVDESSKKEAVSLFEKEDDFDDDFRN